MTRSLYSKFILGYLIFGLLGFIAIATFSSKMTRDYLVQSKADALYDEANIIASSCSTMYQGKRLDSEEVSTQIRALSHYLRAEIWVVNRQGTVVMDSLGGSRVQSSINGFDPASIGNRSYTIGDYYGMFSGNVLSVSAPITGNYNTYGYVLIHLPISEINQSQNGILSILYITSAVLFGLSLIILLVFTQTVYLPLRKITVGANEYAAGNLDYRIDVKTHDEMGYLSDTLNYMSDELNKMEEYQKNFIANVSHDFRSPLTSIKGYVEAMTDGTIPPAMHEKYMKIILFETERLTDLTQDLLTLNEFDTKNILLTKEVFDIHEMIKNVAAAFEGTCTQKKISIELLFATKYLNVTADKRKIQQVLYNLLDNAIKFSETDSTVTIETTERGDKIYTSVKDYGIGIPRNALNKIWERFYKTDLSRGKDKKGTGLGLAIVKEAIQAHGENINVVSTEGVGTEFIFSLPKA